MQYKLKMLGNLKEYLPVAGQYNHCEMNLPQRHTIADAVTGFALPEERPYYVILNGDKLQTETYSSTTLKDGDELVLFPPIKGG